jgi:gamma-glutamyltranspeptidase/glutathione hydrolase
VHSDHIKISRRTLLAAAAAAATATGLAGCGSGDTDPALTGGAVASSDSYSAEAAASILKAGGNAVDAAVAMAFVLAVTYPEAGNIGGGGFMTIWFDGRPHFVDYREMAPAAANSTFYTQFKDASGRQDPLSSLWGAQAAGVPGTVRGLWEAHQKFGRLSWWQVLAPAIALAEQGHVVSPTEVALRDGMVRDFGALPYAANLMEYFGAMVAGQSFKQPELAATLQRIAANGPDEFYQGRTADLIVAAMRQDGGRGIITKADLASYKVVWRDTLRFDWNGMQVHTAPPPSSGGIALAQLLGMKAELASTLFTGQAPNSVQYVHLNAEIMKRVFADRAEYLGDPAFTEVPVAGLLDPAYIRRRAAEVNPTAITPTASVKPGMPKMHTTHFSVIDRWGNAVSNTYTLNMPYGCGVVVRGAGFALNDEMDDFATVPGQPNIFGVVGSDANAVAPGKRPLSSMSPTIVVKDGVPTMVVGTPGGSRIFTAVYQVLANVYDYRMPLPAAVANRRFHHQLPQGNILEGEPFSPIPAELAAQLQARGYTVTTNSFDTDVQAIQVQGRDPVPVSDPRGRGRALVVG